MIYKRYEFNDEEQYLDKVDAFDKGEEGQLLIKANFSPLGYLTLEDAIVNEDGDVVQDAIVSDKYAVDVLWKEFDESPYGWKSYEVEPSNPKHKILGQSW